MVILVSFIGLGAICLLWIFQVEEPNPLPLTGSFEKELHQILHQPTQASVELQPYE